MKSHLEQLNDAWTLILAQDKLLTETLGLLRLVYGDNCKTMSENLMRRIVELRTKVGLAGFTISLGGGK